MSNRTNYHRQPSQLTRQHIAKELERSYLDALVHYLKSGFDLPAARVAASEVKLECFARIVGGQTNKGRPQ
jgi:hypothetical protein